MKIQVALLFGTNWRVNKEQKNKHWSLNNWLSIGLGLKVASYNFIPLQPKLWEKTLLLITLFCSSYSDQGIPEHLKDISTFNSKTPSSKSYCFHFTDENSLKRNWWQNQDQTHWLLEGQGISWLLYSLDKAVASNGTALFCIQYSIAAIMEFIYKASTLAANAKLQVHALNEHWKFQYVYVRTCPQPC